MTGVVIDLVELAGRPLRRVRTYDERGWIKSCADISQRSYFYNDEGYLVRYTDTLGQDREYDPKLTPIHHSTIDC